MQQSGYTLIEIVVVFIIFSLLTAITAPRLAVLYNSVQISYEKNEVIARLDGLSYLALQQRQSFKLTQYPPSAKENQIDPEDKLPTLTIPSLIKEEKSELEKWNYLPEIPLELPENWQLKAEKPIIFHANGVCNGGIVKIIHQEVSVEVKLIEPFCHTHPLR